MRVALTFFLGCLSKFAQYLGVFCAKLVWGVEFVQYLGVFCAKLGWEGVVVLKYCTFAENYREE